MLRHLIHNRNGNIAVITAISITPVLALLGGGVDVVRATTASAKLNGALESAVLAAANLDNTRDFDEVVAEYIAANLVSDPSFRDSITVVVTPVETLNSRTITITATGSIDTAFLGLLGIPKYEISAQTQANESHTNVEIALVMDISSSMNNNRMSNLKSAATSFVNQMFNDPEKLERTSISLVPFGGTVNVGPLFEDLVVDIIDTDNDGVPDATGNNHVNPSESAYTSANPTTTDFRFTNSSINTCIEFEASDFSDDIIPDDSRGQVPHFWKYVDFNPWCPEPASAVFLNSNNATAMNAHINGMTRSDGTGMDIGAAWGLKVLSPAWQGALGGDFASRPAAYSDDTLKVMVIMTDGGITGQHRPEDYTRESTHTNAKNNRNDQRVVNGGGMFATSASNNGVGYFKRVCDEAKQNGVVVYTIGFQIQDNSLPQHTLEYCASDLSKYYLVESLDIQSAFDTIAASVNALRITG